MHAHGFEQRRRCGDAVAFLEAQTLDIGEDGGAFRLCSDHREDRQRIWNFLDGDRLGAERRW